jgi:hypothetical protein
MKPVSDRGGINLGNDEHPDRMVGRTAADKRGGLVYIIVYSIPRIIACHSLGGTLNA